VVQRRIVHQLLGDSGRLFAAGDLCQAIYGFRGADSDAMQQFITEFRMTLMPLSVSYRCSQAVVKEAQKYVTAPGSINYHPSAPVGSVTLLEQYKPTDFTAADCILCRNTAPLITFAFSLIHREIGCRVMGREIGVNLANIVKKVKADRIEDLEQKLVAMRQREVQRALDKGNLSGAAAIEDKYDCLQVFIQNASTIQEVIDNILKLFSDDKKGLLTLATIHKAKGLEWETVFLLDWNLLPSKWARQPSQQQQERNLQYVAASRGKLNLRFIESGQWKPEKVEAAEQLQHPTDEEFDSMLTQHNNDTYYEQQ